MLATQTADAEAALLRFSDKTIQHGELNRKLEESLLLPNTVRMSGQLTLLHSAKLNQCDRKKLTRIERSSR